MPNTKMLQLECAEEDWNSLQYITAQYLFRIRDRDGADSTRTEEDVLALLHRIKVTSKE